MSIFQDFARLQDQVNRLMGDFGSSYGGVQRGTGGRRQRERGWTDPFDMGLGGAWGVLDDDWFDTPLLLTGDQGQSQGQSLGRGQQKQLGSGQGQQLQVKGQEEWKMADVDEKSQQLTRPLSGGLLQTFQPGRLMRARVNIEDAKDKYVVTAEMPSFDKANIKVNVTDDGLLTIKGEQKQEHVEEAKEKRYIRAERTFANVERTIRIPPGVDTSRIQANLENGVLHVHIPKVVEPERKSGKEVTVA